MAFWETKTLDEMTQQQWESVCDHCGKCCLHKLQDDEDEVHYTSVACEYLDLATCQCIDYSNRKSLVPECAVLSREKINQFHWLPSTCAYRLLAEGESLPDWHPLISHNKKSVHDAGVSVISYSVSARDVDEEDFEEYVIHWDI